MFLAFTGCRRSEGAMLEWRNVHLEDDPAQCWWHIEDPKNKNPISLPLSGQAVAVLRARQTANDQSPVKSKYVFPSSSKAGHVMDTRAPLERFAATINMDRLSAHDLRRTFVTLGVKACRLDIAKLELLTNHVPQSVTTKHYLETSDLRDYHQEVQAIGDYEVPDPRADNARHNLCELLVVAFVAVLCGATSCAEMAAFGRAKEHVFRGFLKLKHAIPSHDTFSTVFRLIDPKALDAAFGRVLAGIAALLGDGALVLPLIRASAERIVELVELVAELRDRVAELEAK